MTKPGSLSTSLAGATPHRLAPLKRLAPQSDIQKRPGTGHSKLSERELRGKLHSQHPPAGSPRRRLAIAEASHHQPIQPFGECTRVCRAFAVQDAGSIEEEVGDIAAQRAILGSR